MGDIAGRIKMLFTYQPPSLTGMYDTPTLSVHPGSEVISGENVTFYCRLHTATTTFFLIKEGRSNRPQHKHGNIQADFYMGPVTTAHRGTYRCFGSYNNYLWSFPSEPVTLLVIGDVGNTSLAPTELPSSPDSWKPSLLTTEMEFQKESPSNWSGFPGPDCPCVSPGGRLASQQEDSRGNQQGF
ncbi:PREDICTED: natural cytotoxicity triggering receptor 1 [Hipposideros armiger]|uniref:Natural cytotoxicity triggering receptor 1 n=1 Tax=Hipposideros armiger TaxID=186990 RepID=A0A8B7Q755_HIPAR|nr:PREDICTED: natural cytotoxicity triggering receptor 1 [Hipposideros armiger]